jgi:hypothetical protein
VDLPRWSSFLHGTGESSTAYFTGLRIDEKPAFLFHWLKPSKHYRPIMLSGIS